MTIAQGIVAKLAVAFVTLAMAFTLVAPAQAQNVNDMSLEELIALVNQLQSQIGNTSAPAASSSSVCPFVWTRNLNMGDTGADVMKLQQFLNSMPETQVAPAGSVGSMGMETDYYGPATGAAVANFQQKYRSEVLSPLGLVNPTTFFGNSTRAQANSVCSVAPSMPDMGEGEEGEEEGEEEEGEEEGEEEEEERDDRGASDLTGSADLDTYEIEDAEDDEIEESQEDAPIAELDIEFENGDALIEQIELGFELVDGQPNAEEDPWDTFDAISLWLDGDKIAEVATDDEDDWEGGDENELTFGDLDIFVEEDREITIIVAATTQDGIDFDTNDQQNQWVISIGNSSLGDDDINITEGLRYMDASGFIDEDGAAGTDEVTFEIEEEGTEDELDVRTSSIDPDSETFELEDDEDTSHVVFAFELDADESESDIEFDEITIDFEFMSPTRAISLADLVDVDDAVLIVNGQELDSDDETLANSVPSAGAELTGTGSIIFEFDTNDFVLKEGETVDVEVELEFNSLAMADEGATIRASITGNSTKIDADGADDLDDNNIDGAATGEEHTLRTTGIDFNTTFDGDDGIDESFDLRNDDNDIVDDNEGVFDFQFQIEAFEDDAFIAENVVLGSAASTTAELLALASSSNAGVVIRVVQESDDSEFFGNTASTNVAINFTDSSAEQEASTNYRFDQGEPETISIQAIVNTDQASDFYRVEVLGIAFGSSDSTPFETFQEALPASDFRTDAQNITD